MLKRPFGNEGAFFISRLGATRRRRAKAARAEQPDSGGRGRGRRRFRFDLPWLKHRHLTIA